MFYSVVLVYCFTCDFKIYVFKNVCGKDDSFPLLQLFLTSFTIAICEAHISIVIILLSLKIFNMQAYTSVSAKLDSSYLVVGSVTVESLGYFAWQVK